jgi:hypothetical protein
MLRFIDDRGAQVVSERWTWNAVEHPSVSAVLKTCNWYSQLESAASNALTGKVLCVCAALAAARHVVEAVTDQQATLALDLLESWIDDPTEDRFDCICDTIFGVDKSVEIGPQGVGWWALRTATCSLGNGEAAWALGTVCSAAEVAGFDSEVVRGVAKFELMARCQVL